MQEATHWLEPNWLGAFLAWDECKDTMAPAPLGKWLGGSSGRRHRRRRRCRRQHFLCRFDGCFVVVFNAVWVVFGVVWVLFLVQFGCCFWCSLGAVLDAVFGPVCDYVGCCFGGYFQCSLSAIFGAVWVLFLVVLRWREREWIKREKMKTYMHVCKNIK